MYEEPPPLPFPSLQTLKTVAVDILKVQKTSTTPDVEFKIFDPDFSSAISDKKKRTRSGSKACEVCKKKKIRCDINASRNERCTKTNCQCLHHRVNINKNKNTIDDINIIQQQQIGPNTHATIIDPKSNTQRQHNNNNNNNNAIFNQHETAPSTTVFRKPGLSKSGHFTGETSFCEDLFSQNQPSLVTFESNYPIMKAIPKEPNISKSDQLYLIDIYYENLNPFYPLINKEEIVKQLEYVFANKESYLSPLFYYALFARAAQLQHTPQQRLTADNKAYTDLGEECLKYSSLLIDGYRDKPRISTILALIILANHLEQKKKLEDLTKVWLWVGEAFRMALDLGIHRSFVTNEEGPFDQLCIRTFWLAYVTDCTISMVYGRPLATEEKVLDVTYPKKLENDDSYVSVWIDSLGTLIASSKVTSRVIRFNYCPPPPFIIQGPIKRHNAFLVSVDSWLIDIMHPSEEPESPFSSVPNIVTEETPTARRLQTQKRLFLYTNLILLHRPYVSDILSKRNTNNRPSYDICSYAAIIITDLASKLDTSDLSYHSTLPILAYALIMAVRIHIMNASSSNPEKFNAKRNFDLSICILSKLPQSRDTTSMLYDSIQALEYKYHHRYTGLSNEEENDQHAQSTSKVKQQVITAAQIVFSPNTIEKPATTTGANLPFSQLVKSNANIVEQTSLSNTRIPIKIKDYTNRIESVGRKKKKSKTKHVRHASLPATTTSGSVQKIKTSGTLSYSVKQHDIVQTHQEKLPAPVLPESGRQNTAAPVSSSSAEEPVQPYQLPVDEYPQIRGFTAGTLSSYSFHHLASNAYHSKSSNIVDASISFPNHHSIQNGLTRASSTTFNQASFQQDFSLLYPELATATTSQFNQLVPNHSQQPLYQQQIPLRDFGFLSDDYLPNNTTLPLNFSNNTKIGVALSNDYSNAFFLPPENDQQQLLSTSSMPSEAPTIDSLASQNVFTDHNYI